VGSVSVIGRATQLGETVIARDTATSGVHHKNEYLPDTRAEMALPLIYEDRVLGALDVQSTSPDVFAAEERVLFEALATQLAITIHNNRTFTTMQRSLDTLNVENRRLTFQSWEQVFGRRQGVIDVAVGPSGFTEGGEYSVWQHRAVLEADMVISPPDEEDNVALAIPLISGGQVLGVIEWQVPEARMTESVRQLARTLVSRLSITLDTIRLLERTERLAERERLVNRVSGQIAVEPNIPLILQTAVEELSQILGTSQVNIQLRRAEKDAPVRGPMESAL
jgi:GAF domain-containing protein